MGSEANIPSGAARMHSASCFAAAFAMVPCMQWILLLLWPPAAAGAFQACI